MKLNPMPGPGPENPADAVAVAHPDVPTAQPNANPVAMKTLVFYQPAPPQRAETVMFASLGLAGFVCTVLATMAMLDFVTESSRITAALKREPTHVAATAQVSNAAPTLAKPASLRPPV